MGLLNCLNSVANVVTLSGWKSDNKVIKYGSLGVAVGVIAVGGAAGIAAAAGKGAAYFGLYNLVGLAAPVLGVTGGVIKQGSCSQNRIIRGSVTEPLCEHDVSCASTYVTVSSDLGRAALLASTSSQSIPVPAVNPAGKKEPAPVSSVVADGAMGASHTSVASKARYVPVGTGSVDSTGGRVGASVTIQVGPPVLSHP